MASLAMASASNAQIFLAAKARGAFAGLAGEHADLTRIVGAVRAGSDQDLLQRSWRIATNMAPSFQALPKNSLGRLTGPGVRHLLQTYFSRERGWQIHGLGPHSSMLRNASGPALGANVLQEKAPDVVQAFYGDGGDAVAR